MPPAEPDAIGVLCVDDSDDLTAMFARCIDGEPGMRCVGTLPRADDVPAVIDGQGVHVVLMDMSMPGRDPLDVVRELAAAPPAPQRPATRLILFSGRDDDELIDLAARAGAHAFIAKHLDIRKVLAAIREVAAGGGAFRAWR